ncbi:MAG: CoA transferase [Gammaproteobacteria bacterium]|nr:CoA transferase [Gammaproteobacteria bacterium]
MDQYLFQGLKVIDAATVIAGPAAAMMMADFGADVIKIEEPRRGDMLRWLSNMPDTDPGGENYMWQMDGRNKRSIGLDLKDPRGLKVMHELIAQCDVFITNMPYPSRESFKLSYDDVKPSNPNLIYASLTAYGELGEERDRKGFDQLAYWARSGLMDLMREPGTLPTQGLPGMGDHPTAVSIYAGIVTALLKRERTGEGSFVQTSLLANGLWSISATAQGVMAGGDMQQSRAATERPGFSFRVYQAKDGRWLQFNMVRNEELMNLAFTAMDATDLLVDERYKTPRSMYQHREAVGERIQAIISTKSSDEWLAIFAEFDVPINRIGIVEETPTDSQILLNRMVSKPKDPGIELPLVVNHPVQVSGVNHVKMKLAPELGEHSREVLNELGYETSIIDEFMADGVVVEPESAEST